MTKSTADYIRDLAREHNVAYTPGPHDALANAITRLSGDDVELDEIELLLVALERAGVLKSRDGVLLQAKYLREIKSTN